MCFASAIDFFMWVNDQVLNYLVLILFLGTSIILTIKNRFVQVRAWPRVFRLITRGVPGIQNAEKQKAINPFHALFTAMATTIGIGNVVSPSLAIFIGGPGALFWLLFYMFLGSVTKFCEVSFAVATRKTLPDGSIIGGPIQYLRTVSNGLAYWYGYIIIFVLLSWSGTQANTLANIFALEGVAHWVIGLSLSLFVLIVLVGGAQRVGEISSRLVPIMFVLYIIFAFSILFRDLGALYDALRHIVWSVFMPSSMVGGLAGATIFRSMREGILRGIFICEAGIGTSAIPHSLANTKNPVDQGVLAMGSVLADAILSALSGLLVVVTGIWSVGSFRSTLVYEVFKLNAPGIGQYVLLISITLFAVTTVMGNSFNGVQCFRTLTRDNKFLVRIYMALCIFFIFVGALMPMKLLWSIVDVLLVMVAAPNLIGLLVLTFKRGDVLKMN